MGSCFSSQRGDGNKGRSSSGSGDDDRHMTTSRRAAVTTGEEDLTNFKKVVHPKPADVTSFLVTSLAAASVFAELDELTVGDLVAQMFPVTVKAGEDLIVQGDEGDKLYVVESGEFKAFISQHGDRPVAQYREGKLFGELALLYNSPRAATIRCTQAGKLWALDRRAFRGTVTKVNVQSNEHFLKSVPIFASLSDRQRAALARSMVTRVYTDGEYIVKKGEVADALYFIKSGEVMIHTKDPSENFSKSADVHKQRAGEFFGENAIYNKETAGGATVSARNINAVRSANVIADGKVIVLRLSASDFHALIGSLTAALEHNFTLKVIDSMPLFAPLTDKQRNDLASKMKEVRYVKGDDVIKEGRPGEAFYIIKSGAVQVLSEGKGMLGTNKEIAKLGPSDYFGERSLLTHEKTSATVRCVSAELVCYSISSKVFSQTLGSLQTIINAFESEIKRRDDMGSRAKIALTQLEHRRTLGVGTFGRVKLVRDTKSGRAYALKILDKRQVVHLKQEQHILQEKSLLALCNHPFIIELVSTYQDADKLYMLMDICLGGELFSRMHSAGPFSEPDAKFYASCVTAAFSYMHQRRIAYRDLKPENLLFDDKGYLKLVDFGFAKQVLDRTLTLCGTPEYLAPEIILNKSHDIGVDWWTVGVLLFEMIAGHPPFSDRDPMVLYQKIIRGKVKYPARISKDAKHLMSKLIEVNPAIRIGASTDGQEVKDHPFFKGMDWAALERKELKAPYVPNISNPFDDSNYDRYDESDADKEAYAHIKIPSGTFDAF